MSKPVTDRALEIAWPGSGLPNTAQSRTAHGANTSEAHDRDDADQPQALRRGEPRRRQASQAQASGEPDRLVAGQRRGAQQQADRQQPRVREARAARVAEHAGHQQAGAQGEHAEQDRGVRQGGVEEERQVDGRGEARSRSPASAPGPRGSRALARHVRGQAPRQDRQDRARRARDRPARRASRSPAGSARPRPSSAIGIATSSDGQRQPDLERRAREHQRRRAVAPQRVRDEPAALHEVARHAHVVGACPRASGRRRRRRRRPGRPGRTRRCRARSATPRGGSPRAPPALPDRAAASAQRDRQGVVHTG